ncbi:hypothetical protein G3M48_005424 [Beauveria asiatica]|uniref:Uncharacterized protein n=1 Tax=Beauveria asiatica TaxID=1069075 RepID=A0AAW0S587_9HYPO
MTTHTEWLNGPEDVVFAWAELQMGGDRTGQIRLLLKEESAKETDSNNYSIFVVASELEQRLLITRVNKDEGDMLRNSTRVAVHSYQSLLESLRSTDCVFWQKQSVNIFCQSDIYCSAAFCLAIMQMMHAVRTKAFKARCRCLIMVPSPEFVRPLMNALDLICPKEKFTQVNIPQLDFEAELPISCVESSGFVDYVVEKATEAINRRKTVIIFCTKSTAYRIFRNLPQHLPQENCLWNEVAHADFIAKMCLPAFNTEEAVVLFMTESYHVPLFFNYACHIFIEGLKDTPAWNRSRIVYGKQVLTTYEAECMLSYWYQCHPGTALTITDRTLVKRTPRRLVDHKQSWGFLADLALHFTEFRVPTLATCFMTRPNVLQTVMTHFALMGFLHGKSGELYRPFTVSEDAEKLAKILVLMDHDFHLAWFVCMGMRLPDASVNARCAIMRIGALAMCNFGAVNKPFFSQNSRSRLRYQGAVDALVLKLQGHASMPRHLYGHGLPWVTLMIWHLAQKLYPGIRTGELQDMLAEWTDVPMCVLDMAQCAQVSNIVSALETHYGIQSATQALHLTDADCENIQRAMVAAWMHKTMMIEHDGQKSQVIDVAVADMAERRLAPGIGEILQPNWVLNSPGTRRDLAFFVALHVQVEDNGQHSYNNSVVLPMKLVGSWRGPCGDTFLDCAPYRGPDDP